MRLNPWIAALVLLCLSACGGGGADEPPPIPARAGAASIGPAGGSVDAVLEGGTSVVLVVPAGALTSSVGFRIDPEAATPPDTLGQFTISPAGVTLLKPVTLTVTLPPGVQAGPAAGLAVDSPNGAVPLGAILDAATRQISVQLSFLPPATAVAGRAFPASAQRARPAAADVAARVRMRLERGIDSARRNNTFLSLVDLLRQQGSIDNAIVVQLAADSLALGAVSAPDVATAMTDWLLVVCGQRRFAVSALNTFNGVDVVSFRRLSRDAMVWTLLALDMNATLRRAGSFTCPGLPDDFRQPVIDRLPVFVEAVTASLNRLDARAEFDQILKARLPELVDLESMMQEFDLGPAVLNLIGAQAVRLRVAAYQACRSDGDQLLQKDLLESTPLFSVTTPFSEAGVREDIQFCGMPLRWQLKNEIGQIVGEGAAGGIAAGQTLAAVNLPLTGVSQLVLMGPLSALRCVSREPGNGGVDRVVRRQNNEQLSLRAGPLAGALTSVGLMTPSNEETYLAVSTLELDVAQLRPLALPAGPPGSGRLVVTRQGEVCSGAFANLSAHDTIVTFGLNFDSVRITTASLPGSTVGSTYGATLTAQGGQQPYTWGASGLPPGLSLNASTGAISGTPTTPGNFTVGINLTTADGLVDAASLSLAVTDARLWVGTLVVDWKQDASASESSPPDPFTGLVSNTITSSQHEAASMTFDVMADNKPGTTVPFVVQGSVGTGSFEQHNAVKTVRMSPSGCLSTIQTSDDVIASTVQFPPELRNVGLALHADRTYAITLLFVSNPAIGLSGIHHTQRNTTSPDNCAGNDNFDVTEPTQMPIQVNGGPSELTGVVQAGVIRGTASATQPFGSGSSTVTVRWSLQPR
jgi:Putative Ig domain